MAAIELFSTPLYSDANLVAYYRLEDTSDSKGSYTLTNTGTTPFNAAKFNNGADFGNPNTTKRLNNDSVNAALSYPKTAVGWFNANIVNDNGNVITFLDIVNNVDYYQLKLRNTDSHIVFRSNNQTQAADVDTGLVASTGTWYHFALNWTSTTNINIYINGTSTNANASIFAPTYGSGRFSLGALARTTGAIQWFSGIIDDVGLFNRSLTATEISNLYNGTWSVNHNLSLLGVGA